MKSFKKELTELIKKYQITDYRTYIVDCIEARDDAMVPEKKTEEKTTISQFIVDNPGMTSSLRNKLIELENIGEVKYVSDIIMSEFRKMRNVGQIIEDDLRELLEN